MRLMFAGDFRVGYSSGYAVILEQLCLELSKRHEITVVGTQWHKKEHHYPFQVIPSDYTWLPMQIMRLARELKTEHCVLAMDVPKIDSIVKNLVRQGIVDRWPPFSGLFPIEGSPVAVAWTHSLNLLEHRFVISEWAVEKLAERSLNATWVPMTSTMPDLAEGTMVSRGRLKKLVYKGINADLLDECGPMFVTVADNQERKDLPVIGRALTELRDQGVVVPWLLVTNVDASYGWTLSELWDELWITDQVVMFENLSNEELSRVYNAATVFVLASQAEGACLPLYEAMAHGLTCVAPDLPTIREALGDGRGYLVEPRWWTIHPWGNVVRHHTDAKDLAEWMLYALGHTKDPSALRQFIENRSWSKAAKAVEGVLTGEQKREKGAREKVSADVAGGA